MKKFLSIISFVLVLAFAGCGRIKHPSVQEYIAGQGNIKGNVNTADFYERDQRFEIGATKEGMAVFKNPNEAYKALVENYSDGLLLIQNEFGLEPVSQKDYEMYKTYGWQVTGGTDEEKKQARFISSFFDIYENSFE